MDNRKFDGKSESAPTGVFNEKKAEGIPKVPRRSDVVGLSRAEESSARPSGGADSAKTMYFSKPKAEDMGINIERSKLGVSPAPGTVSPSVTPVRPASPATAARPASAVRPDGVPRVRPDVKSGIAAKTEVMPTAKAAAPVSTVKSEPSSAVRASETVPNPAPAVASNKTAGNPNNGETIKIDAPSLKSEQENKEKNKKDKKKKPRTERSEAGNTVISLIKCMAYITSVLVISIFISVAVIFAANDIYGFVKSDEQIEITIPQNATIDDVADVLYNNKIIKYKWLFKFKEGDFAGKFAAGTHTVTPLSSYDKLIDTLSEKPPVGISWITIPEGFTTDEIINLLVSSGIGKRENYIDVINNYDFDYWFVDEIGENWKDSGRIYRLDGYLFPDTYQFYNASSEVTVIEKLLARFNQVFAKSYKESAAEIGYTVDEIMIIASLIEKEAGDASDFGNVSSVFHNRLKNPSLYPYLESDATIAYLIQHETGVRPSLTGTELDNIDSPYNSHKQKGFIPGPIATPSNSAILAALNPSETNYYFFVSDGSDTFFNETLQAHQDKVNEIAAKRAQGQTNN